MSQSTACYASPKIVREFGKVFGDKASAVHATMRRSKDVPRFIRKVEAAHKKAAKSKLQFD